MNGELIWRISPYIMGQISSAQIVGEIEELFLPNALRQQLFAWHTKVGEIDPWY